MSQSEEELLEDRFRKLTLGGGEGKLEKHDNNGLNFENDLKSMLKEISNLQDPTVTEKFKNLISDTLERYEQVISTLSQENNTITRGILHDKISCSVIVLKALAETPLPKTDDVKNADPFWDRVISPNISVMYNYISHVFRYCDQNFSTTTSSSAVGGPEGDHHYNVLNGNNAVVDSYAGFARHQILHLLQQSLRMAIVFLKRGLKNLAQTQTTSATTISMEYMGLVLCDLLNSEADFGLELRRSIGLSITGLILHHFKGWNQDVVNYFETIFTITTNSSQSYKESDNRILSLLENLVRISGKDVNRIGIAIGVLCSLEFEEVDDVDVDFSNLMYLIAKNILDLDHGTQEVLNLGAARVIEHLTDKISNPSKNTPIKTIQKVSSLFGSMEFFVFSYIPGHIDAVKNCCRNILGSLTRIYQRIKEEHLIQNTDLMESLLKTILSKDAHVKWIALSCVTKNSPLSIKVLEIDNNLPINILNAKRECKNSASECYVSLMSYDFVILDRHVWEQRWILPLFDTQSSQNTESWSQKKIIIKTILKPQKITRTNIIQVMIQPLLKFVITRMNSTQAPQQSDKNDITESTMLAAETIKLASELGLHVSLLPEEKDKNAAAFCGGIPRPLLNSWLWNANPQIRLTGVSLLVETKKTSQVFHLEDFESLKILLKYNLVSQTAAFRQEFISYFKKFILRLRDSQALLKRQKDTDGLKNYNDFFVWMWNFLTNDDGLFTGANFGRRCQSLECLSELVSVFGDLSIFNVQPDNANLKYLSWLTDSFENNKIRALEILLKMPIPAFQEEEMCKSIFEEALFLCESVKPPDSTTGRYLMVLLMKKTNIPKYSPTNILQCLFEKLEQTYVLICETSLTEVACENPMYGVIRCIRMVLTSATEDFLSTKDGRLLLYRSYFDKLIVLLLKYEEILFPILGNAAPEGFLPGLPDSSDDNNQVVRSITAQMLLVCSWRSMRDVCLLFTDMCVLLPLEGEKTKSTVQNDDGGGVNFILSFDQVSLIGNHMLHLMKNLVHRGVFEQVSVGFKTLATRLWKSSNPKLCALPLKWLNEAMDEEHMSSKCITRRSAGLPFIFQALLSAECDNSIFIGEWVTRLFVRDESPINSLVRIHAMNVLRGLFRDTNFSKAMMPFVPDGLRIAFRALKSGDWTERNSGLMLYGALIRRTFGPKLNLMSSPIFFRRFSQMYDFLLEQLDVCLKVLNTASSSNNKTMEGSDFTFHLLLLLASFSPAGRLEDEHFKLSEFIVKLRQCAASPDVEVRKLAAKAIIPFLNSPNDYSVVLNIVVQMLEPGNSKLSLNHIHGNLIQMAVIINYISKDNSEIIIKGLSNLFTPEYFSEINCPSIFEAIANVILAFDNFEQKMLRKFFNTLTDVYNKRFDTFKITQRNIVPGLLQADSKISRGTILFTLSSFRDLDNQCLFKTLYDWLISCNNLVFLEQLLECLCDIHNYTFLVQRIFNGLESSCELLLQTVISCYLNTKFNYIGQSTLELKFLDLLTRINDIAFENCLKRDKEELTDKFMNRLFTICVGSSSTTEHKRFAFICLCKISFWTEIEITKEQQQLLCLTLIKWTDSSIDDDLRFGAAIGVPRVPLTGPLRKFSVIDQCKIWLAVLVLAQDDDSDIRNIVSSKMTANNMMACDRKSLENLIECYFENLVKFHPLEGLIVLIGLVFKDDYEIKTEEANDEEEGRLFDKSEMNMFNEPIILAKIIKGYLENKNLTKSFKHYFDQVLSPELSELYEMASNTKLFICSPSLSTLLNLIKMRLDCDQLEEIENKSTSNCDKYCSNVSSTMNAVQSTILSIVTEAFL